VSQGLFAVRQSSTDKSRATFPNFVRKGLGAGAYGTPRVPCFDFAGIVQAVGDSGEWNVGDEVFGRITKPSGKSAAQDS
jgi:NADPH:quinone reductase-like Zn-dependent oxidoreductase